MTSERRIKANQANAKKSTGPKTEAGKAASSKNAIKHRMCAKTHVTDSRAEEEAMGRRLEAWAKSLGVTDDELELDLLGLAVRSYHRVERGLRADEAESLQRVRHAEDAWHREQADKLVERVERLHEKPMMGLMALKRTVAGCDYLLEGWRGIREALKNNAWSDECHLTLRRLMGVEASDQKRETRHMDVWHFHLMKYMNFYHKRDYPIAFEEWHERVMRVENIQTAVKTDQETLLRLYEAALPYDQKYTAFIDERIAEVEAIRAGLVKIEEADLAESGIRALHDAGDAGKLRLRYLSDSQRDMYKALREVRELRAERLTIEAESTETEDLEEDATDSEPESAAEPAADAPRNEPIDPESSKTHMFTRQIPIAPIAPVSRADDAAPDA